MKAIYWIAFCGLFLAPSLSIGQTKDIKKIYRKFKKDSHAVSMTLPGWLINLGSNIAVWSSDDIQEKEALRLMKKVKRMKLLVLEDGAQKIDGPYVQGLFAKLRADDYEDLVQVRDEDARVNIMIREDDTYIKNLFLLVREADEAVMISMKTKLTMDQINKVLNIIEDDIDVSLND